MKKYFSPLLRILKYSSICNKYIRIGPLSKISPRNKQIILMNCIENDFTKSTYNEVTSKLTFKIFSTWLVDFYKVQKMPLLSNPLGEGVPSNSGLVKCVHTTSYRPTIWPKMMTLKKQDFCWLWTSDFRSFSSPDQNQQLELVLRFGASL